MKYLVWFFVILFAITLIRAVYPTVSEVNACMVEFEKNLPSRNILTKSGNSENAKKFCEGSLKSITQVNKCIASSRNKEKIKGLADTVRKINETTSILGKQISSATIEHNTDCEYFKELMIKN